MNSEDFDVDLLNTSPIKREALSGHPLPSLSSGKLHSMNYEPPKEEVILEGHSYHSFPSELFNTKHSLIETLVM